MPEPRPPPFPLWLAAVDFLAAAGLALGLLILFAPETAVAFGLPAALGWPLAVLGGIGCLACGVAFLRFLRAQRSVS